jgi:hypothetical protein
VIRIRDTVGRTLAPLVVVVHAFGRYGRGRSWRVAIFDGRGDIAAVYPDGPVRLEERVAVEPLEVSWEWLELLSRLLEDLTDLEVVGDLEDGTRATIRCFDSSYWEIEATPALEAALAQQFEVVERIADLG